MRALYLLHHIVFITELKTSAIPNLQSKTENIHKNLDYWTTDLPFSTQYEKKLKLLHDLKQQE